MKKVGRFSLFELQDASSVSEKWKWSETITIN